MRAGEKGNQVRDQQKHMLVVCHWFWLVCDLSRPVRRPGDGLDVDWLRPGKGQRRPPVCKARQEPLSALLKRLRLGTTRISVSDVCHRFTSFQGPADCGTHGP